MGIPKSCTSDPPKAKLQLKELRLFFRCRFAFLLLPSHISSLVTLEQSRRYPLTTVYHINIVKYFFGKQAQASLLRPVSDQTKNCLEAFPWRIVYLNQPHEQNSRREITIPRIENKQIFLLKGIKFGVPQIRFCEYVETRSKFHYSQILKFHVLSSRFLWSV